MFYKLHGSYQHYAWGGEDFIPDWQHLTEREAKPYAEYWLGAHPSAPSQAVIDGTTLPLNRLLSDNPELLSARSRTQFGIELPFLLKILDVKQPLSIQLHPTKAQAERGFEQENQAGIALDAPNRTYKDRNHKPEMMIALSDFWLLHGFKPIAQIKASLNRYPSLQALNKILEQQGLEALYQQIMQASQTQLADWLIPIIHARQALFQAEQIAMTDPDYWLFSAMQLMNIREDKLDAGLLCFYLFNIVNVKQGEGIYQGAGLPHAYLRGQCIELMAASDNVIRGGLTPKYIDIPALLETVNYQEVTPKLLQPAPHTSSQPYIYPTNEASDFELQRLGFETEKYKIYTKEISILLLMSGEAILDNQIEQITLRQGESILVGAESNFTLMGTEAGYAVLATLPA